MPRGLFDNNPLAGFEPSWQPTDQTMNNAKAIMRFIILAEKTGEISKEQSSSLAAGVYNALRQNGHNLPPLGSWALRQQADICHNEVMAPVLPTEIPEPLDLTKKEKLKTERYWSGPNTGGH